MGQSYDVAVIGAGIVGVSTAMHLLMRGKKVVLLDRKGAGLETSYGNAGTVGNTYVLPFSGPDWRQIIRILLDRDVDARIQYSSYPRHLLWLYDFYMNSRTTPRYEHGKLLWPLVSISTEEHRVLMEDTDAARHLHSSGRLVVYRTPSSFAKTAFIRNVAKERGVPCDVLEPATIREMEPDLKPIYHKGIYWKTSDSLGNPGAVTAAYAQRFANEGGTFTNTNVKALHTSYHDRWQIETGQGEITADHVAVCAGPWAPGLIRPLGYNFPMALKRGYHQHFSSAGGAKLSRAIADSEGGYALVPMEQGFRLTTGVEFANPGAPPTPVQLARALKNARQLFPLDATLDPKPWMGSRPCFADSLPLIARAQRHKGLWFNIGHGHMGMTLGPPSGRLLAEMMTNTPPFCDTAPYGAERFNG
jgi:D-amino-acid dehydrogenase